MSKIVSTAFKLTRISLAHYFQKYVKDFLVLPGPIEIDETKVIVSQLSKLPLRFLKNEVSNMVLGASIQNLR